MYKLTAKSQIKPHGILPPETLKR